MLGIRKYIPRAYSTSLKIRLYGIGSPQISENIQRKKFKEYKVHKIPPDFCNTAKLIPHIEATPYVSMKATKTE